MKQKLLCHSLFPFPEMVLPAETQLGGFNVNFWLFGANFVKFGGSSDGQEGPLAHLEGH